MTKRKPNRLRGKARKGRSGLLRGQTDPNFRGIVRNYSRDLRARYGTLPTLPEEGHEQRGSPG